jgi:general secretion pathway protein A
MSMYLQHFKLHRPPFEMSPDPKFLYLSSQHAQALANIEFALLNRDSFVIISGEIGMGKTTLLNKVLSELNHDIIAARIAHTTLSPIELLQSILAEFGLKEFDDNKVRLLQQLRRFLEHQYQEDRQVLIMVDEAQNLTLETLEELRLVSGIEFSSVKLVSIVLAGQPGLNELINSPQLTQLRQRTRLRQHISPLSRTETHEYMRTRLELAGGKADDIFSSGSIDAIHAAAGGVPRLMNTLCDTVLTGCCVENMMTVNKSMVARVIQELSWDTGHSGLPEKPGTAEIVTPPVQGHVTPPAPQQNASQSKAHGWLISANEQDPETRIAITKLPFIIGRSVRNNFQLRNPDISRRHVIIHADNGTLLVEDLNSANGTLLNGKRIKTAHMCPGDLVQLGSVMFIFRESPDDQTEYFDEEDDTGTHPQLTIPHTDSDAQKQRKPRPSGSAMRDARGRFASRGKFSRRNRG